MPLNLPNILTLSRIVAIPLVVAAFYLDQPAAAWTTFALFAYASLTDYLDGWLARRWSQTSDFGRFLDPIADKLLVAAILVMLVANGVLGGAEVVAVVLILIREILVSGLREFLADKNVGMPVSRIAKWKTAIQLLAIALLLLTGVVDNANLAGVVLLWAATVLTVYTGLDYLRVGLAHMVRGPAEGR
jgi:cardiolipin synthase